MIYLNHTRMIFKLNLCAYNLIWTVLKFSGIVVVFVQTIHTENNPPNNTRGKRIGRISLGENATSSFILVQHCNDMEDVWHKWDGSGPPI
jgi:hypothetical protein